MVSSSLAPVVPTPAKIVVRILNSNQPDDILTFTPDMESDGFNVTFDQQMTLMKTTHWIDYDDVVEYLETFFNSLSHDVDPRTCTSVQIEVPGLPCVMLKKTNMIPYLYSVVDDYLQQLKKNEEWPLESLITK